MPPMSPGGMLHADGTTLVTASGPAPGQDRHAAVLAIAAAALRADLDARMPAARAEFLRRYRGLRRGGLRPYTAIAVIRGSGAGVWLRAVMGGYSGSLAELAVAWAAEEAMTSRERKPLYWWTP